MISTRVLRKKNFGCRFVISIAVSGVCLALVLSLGAFQRHPPHKLRALALLEMNPATGGERLVPIAILDGGRFHDAGIYEPRPRPMALADGVVYEAQTNGMPAGYFTVTSGKKVQETWIGEGIFIPGSGSSASKSKGSSSDASKAPAPDDRPILHRPNATETPAGIPPEATKPPASSTPPPVDDDRPVLRRPDSSSPPAGNASPDAAKPPAAASQPEPSQEDPDRPKLRRGPPSGSDATPARAGSAQPTGPTKTPSATSTNAKGKLLPFYVAVSDVETSYPRSYEFTWKAGELAEAEERMRKLAIAQIAPEKTGPAPATGKTSKTGKTAAARPAKTKPPALPELSNVMIRSFDLDYANDAVMVLTAEFSLPAAPSATTGATPSTSAAAKPPTRYIALIARLNGQGELVKISSSVTDSGRLDVAPHMELIDAVDAEGTGTGELLFREYGFDQKSFVIYRIGRTTITTLFEGAAQPLHEENAK